MAETTGKASPVTATLAAYIAGALRKPLPPEVVEKTKHHVLDTLAAMVSGSRLLPGRKATEYVKARGGVSGGRPSSAQYRKMPLPSCLCEPAGGGRGFLGAGHRAYRESVRLWWYAGPQWHQRGADGRRRTERRGGPVRG